MATDDSGKLFIDYLMSSASLVAFYDFDNSSGLFSIHRSYKFSLVVIGPPGSAHPSADFVFYASHPRELADPDRHIALTAERRTVSGYGV